MDDDDDDDDGTQTTMNMHNQLRVTPPRQQLQAAGALPSVTNTALVLPHYITSQLLRNEPANILHLLITQWLLPVLHLQVICHVLL
jgi:hypothetical protein